VSTIIRKVSYPAMDGIRFYAAFVVVLQHFIGGAALEYLRIPEAQFTAQSPSSWVRFFAWLADGNHGVDVFFLISGFLMARIVLHSRDFSYAGFIWSRVKRIYPAFLVSLVIATIACTQVFGWPWSPVDFAKDLFFLNAIPGYVQYPYNHVTWSLGYEFAFYLVIPVLLLMSRFLDRRVAAGMLVLASAYFLPDTGYIRALGLFLGALIGSFDDATLARFARRVPLTLAFAAFVGCGIARNVLALQYLQSYYFMLASAAVLLVKIVWDPECELGRFFSLPVLRWLGTLSYSIYLYHSIAASLVLVKLTPAPASVAGAIWYASASAALTLFLAWASYMLLERHYFASRKASKSVLHPASTPAEPAPVQPSAGA
jgi:peptidoglycan/LPS O-acetylase OafA/YrhL